MLFKNQGKMIFGANKFWKQISILESTTTRISYRYRFTGFARCRLIWVNGMAFVLSSRGNPYTSKASFLDDDFMPAYGDKNTFFVIDVGAAFDNSIDSRR